MGNRVIKVKRFKDGYVTTADEQLAEWSASGSDRLNIVSITQDNGVIVVFYWGWQ